MRLQDKFKKVFIFPLICGVLVSIVCTITFLFFFGTEYQSEEIVSKVKDIDIDKVQPYIESVRSILYTKFQRSFNSLDIISKYFKFYAKTLNSTINKTLINQYSINTLEILNNKEKIYNLLIKENNSTYLGNYLFIYRLHFMGD